MQNVFCDQAVLRNEADVEQCFVRRLLHDLGYQDEQILPKQSLDELAIGGMRSATLARPYNDVAVRISHGMPSDGKSVGIRLFTLPRVDFIAALAALT